MELKLLFVLIVVLLGSSSVRGASQYWDTINPVNLQASSDSWDEEKVSAAVNTNTAANGGATTIVVVWSSQGSSSRGIRSTVKARRLQHDPSTFTGQIQNSANNGDEKVIYTATDSTIRSFDNDVATDNVQTWVIVFSTFGTSNPVIFLVRSTDDAKTWSAPVQLDPFKTPGHPDLGVQIIFDARASLFYSAWLSGSTRNSSGTDLDVAFSTSHTNGATWTTPIWANVMAANDTEDESNVRIALGPHAGCVHVLYSSNNSHGSLDAGTDGDIFITSSCDNGTTFSNTQVIAPLEMLNATNFDKDSSFDAVADATGTNLVVVYRVTKYGSIATVVKGVESHNGGQNFSDPEVIHLAFIAGQTDSPPTVNTDSKGLFITAFGSKKLTSRTASTDYSSVYYDPDTLIDTQEDIDVFYSVASTIPSGIPGSGWSKSAVTDETNAQIDQADHDAPVLVQNAKELWFMFLTSDQVTVNGVQYGPDRDVFFDPLLNWAGMLCWHNGPGFPSYCPPGLQLKIDSLPMNTGIEYNVPIVSNFQFGSNTAQDFDSSTATVKIGNGRRIKIVRADAVGAGDDLQLTNWGYAQCYNPYFTILDSTSGIRLDVTEIIMTNIQSTYVVKNLGNSSFIFLEYVPDTIYGLCSDLSGNTAFACPLGYRPPEVADGTNYYPKYCVPCPAGVSCGRETQFVNSSSLKTLCPAGRYCPLGTADPELNKCDVLRHYNSVTDVGLSSYSECLTHGQPCQYGYWCAPGTLDVDSIQILTNDSASFTAVDETLVFPSIRTSSITVYRSHNLILTSQYPNENGCYIPDVNCGQDPDQMCMDGTGTCDWYNWDSYQCDSFNSVSQPSWDDDGCNKYIQLVPNDTIPAWLTIIFDTRSGDDDSLEYPGDNATLYLTLLSQAEGVSVSEVTTLSLAHQYFALWETFPYLRDVMLPLQMTFRRAVTTVIFNPSDAISAKKQALSGNFTVNATMFNVGCDQSVTWTSTMWDCSNPAVVSSGLQLYQQDPTLYPVRWLSNLTGFSSGFIGVGVTDPSTIGMVVDPTKVDVTRAEQILGLKRYTACCRVNMIMSTDPSNVLMKDITVTMDTYENCPPGSFSDIGTSENGPCTLCAPGTYTDVSGSTLCKACPEAFPRSSLGAASADACRAAPGYFRDVNNTSVLCSTLGQGVTCLDEGVTLETIRLIPGYWRASNTSKHVFSCPVKTFCVGGIYSDQHTLNGTNLTSTRRRLNQGKLQSQIEVLPVPAALDNDYFGLSLNGGRRLDASSILVSEAYCYPHHRGPYCQVCEPGYVIRGQAPCAICDPTAYSSDQQRLGWTILGAIILVLLAFLVTQRNRLRTFTKNRAASIVGLAKKGMRRLSVIDGTGQVQHHPATSTFSSSVLVVEKAAEGSVLVRDSESSNGNVFAPDKRTAGLARARSLARTMSLRFRPISTGIDKRVTFLWSIVISIEASTTLRILVSLFQVIGAISSNFSDLYPAIFGQIASVFNALSAEVFYNIDFACVIHTNHYLSLVLGMLAPALATLLILGVHIIFERRLKQAHRYEDVHRLRTGTYSLFLVLLFLIYPNVSATILSSFLCKQFDDGSSWLRTDITISCEASDRYVWLIVASFGVIIYVVGIPLCYTWSLVRVRHEINPPDKNKIPDKAKFAQVLFLTDIYKRQYWYWEVFELIRKLVQTSLVIFFLDGSVIQFIVMMVISMVLIQVINEWKPYISEPANKLASVAQWEILLVSFIGLLLRVDLSTLDSTFSYDKTTLLTVCIVMACFIAPIFAIYQQRRWLRRFILKRRCGLRRKELHGSKSNDDEESDEEEAESPFFDALLNPWSTVAKMAREHPNQVRDKSKEELARDSSSTTGMMENPIAFRERQTSLSIASTVPSPMTKPPQARMVSFNMPLGEHDMNV